MGFLSFAHSEFNNFCFYYGSIAIYLIFEPKCKLLLLLLIFVVVVVVGVFFSLYIHCIVFVSVLREMCDRVSIYLRLLLIFAGVAAAIVVDPKELEIC